MIGPCTRRTSESLSFFTPLDAAGEEHHPGSSQTRRVFDVTENLRSLASEGMKDVNVVFEASTGREGAETAHFNAQSKLVVDIPSSCA